MAAQVPNYDQCSLLLPMRGSNGSTTFTDYSTVAKTVTANGNAQISTAQSKWYGSSGLLDGTGDWLNVTHHADLNLPAVFTFGIWFRPTSLTGTIGLVGKRASEAAYSPLSIEIVSGVAKFFASTSGAAWAVNALTIGSPTLDAWNLIVICADGSNVYPSLNGTVGASAALSSSLMTNTNALTLGASSASPSGASALTGNMQDCFMLNNAAPVVFKSNFTPPGALTGLISGNVKDENGDNAVGRKIWAVPRSYFAGIKEDTTDASGNYSFDILPSTEHTIIMVQDVGATFNDQVLGQIIPGGS